MKTMKRMIGILLTAAMTTALLAGCGGGDTGSAGGSAGDGSGASGGSDRGNVMMTFGTGDTGGSLYPAGAALSQLWTNSVSGVKCNSVLVEVCFCDSADDCAKYTANRDALIKAYADVLERHAKA